MENHLLERFLYRNDNNLSLISEYFNELDTLKSMIDYIETAVERKGKDTVNLDTYEGVCHAFASSIVSYAKSAYDTMILGHFDATRSILRTLIENVVCLDVIASNEEKGLWKYYIISSIKRSVDCRTNKRKKIDWTSFEELCNYFDIEEEFLNGRKKEKGNRGVITLRPFVEENYGWAFGLFPKHDSIKFSTLCEYVEKKEHCKFGIYQDFGILSEYTHGTTIANKVFKGVFLGELGTILSIAYMYLELFIIRYCAEQIDERYFTISKELSDKILKMY